MKINLRVLGDAMYSGKARYVDLDNGEIVSLNLIDLHIVPRPRRMLSIPLHFPDEIYYPYIALLLERDPSCSVFMEKWYPELVEMQRAYPDCHPYKYIGEAFHFTSDYSEEILERRGTQECIASNVPTYEEYSTDYKKRAAMEWCRQECLEWYE